MIRNTGQIRQNRVRENTKTAYIYSNERGRYFVTSITCYDFLFMTLAGLRTERPKQRTTRYVGARQKLYKKISKVVQ